MEQQKQPEEELRLIVRIINTDLDGNLPIHKALMKIKGLGHRTARIIAYELQKQHGVPFNKILGKMPAEMDKKLEEIILHPEKSNVPAWAFNRQKDFETGKNMHLVMNELDFSLRKDLERMKKIKSYRGVRHMYGLPVRGQKTRSSFRKKGAAVGVVKKEAKAAAAATKKEEKKK